jgi:hypothetical protein
VLRRSRARIPTGSITSPSGTGARSARRTKARELTKLYQLYAGHDNNRDWFTLTQPETRIVTKLLYETWRPQVYWDVHQQEREAERMFVPPFRDPLDPEPRSGHHHAINLLGTRAMLDMTREGAPASRAAARSTCGGTAATATCRCATTSSGS